GDPGRAAALVVAQRAAARSPGFAGGGARSAALALADPGRTRTLGHGGDAGGRRRAVPVAAVRLVLPGDRYPRRAPAGAAGPERGRVAGQCRAADGRHAVPSLAAAAGVRAADRPLGAADPAGRCAGRAAGRDPGGCRVAAPRPVAGCGGAGGDPLQPDPLRPGSPSHRAPGLAGGAGACQRPAILRTPGGGAVVGIQPGCAVEQLRGHRAVPPRLGERVMSRLREHPLHAILGLVIWSLWFVALYGGQGVGCALAPPPVEDGAATWLNAALGLFTLLIVALLVGLALFSWRSAAPGSPQRF